MAAVRLRREQTMLTAIASGKCQIALRCDLAGTESFVDCARSRRATSSS